MEVDIMEAIAQAEMILVGLGEEFNGKKFLKNVAGYQETEEQLEKQVPWILPAYRESHLQSKQQEIHEALTKLADLLQEKNYFVLSTSTNRAIGQIPWKHGFAVMPCGSNSHMQCGAGCQEETEPLTELQQEKILGLCRENGGLAIGDKVQDILGSCPHCGSSMVLNNYYHEKYIEAGYLDKWGLYTKWLQGTLNRKLLILELGAEFECPSVMRWPFEKVAFYNQKATMIRVNERLYQLTEELKEKGVAIPQNAIEWIQML